MTEFFKRHKPVPAQRQFAHGRQGTGYETAYRTREAGAEKPQFDRRFMQIHDSFIIAQDEEGFIIVDQHALHERVIYENLCRRIRQNKLESQRLLIPESFEVFASEADVLENNAELIERLGIELAPFGPKTMAVQSFPTLLAGAAPLDFVRDLIDLLSHKAADLDAERLLEEVLNMAACKAAIKAGQKLNDNEIEQLLADRQIVEGASRCPHGRPTTIKFTISDLEKQFKRT
jgi:DNA mismatch repair protein MutL